MGVDGIDAGLQSTSAVFSRFAHRLFFFDPTASPTAVFQLPRAVTRCPPFFSTSYLTQRRRHYCTLSSTCPRPPSWANKRPPPPPRNPPVPEVPDSCHPNQPSEPTHSVTGLLPTASSCKALGNITPLCLQKSSSLSPSPHRKQVGKSRSAANKQSLSSSFAKLHSRHAPPSRRSPALRKSDQSPCKTCEPTPSTCVCGPASAPAWATKKTSKEGNYC